MLVMSSLPDDIKNDLELEIDVVMRTADFVGVEAVLSEPDLHKRFPGIIPRFSHNRDSELLIVDEAQLDPSSDYLCIEIPIGRQSSSSSPPQSLENEDIIEPPSKRAKLSSDQTHNTMKAYIPQFTGDLSGLSYIKQQLKDSARRSEVLFGFVITLLGGVLHLSYPPILDEAKLYCEVISLYKAYEHPMGEIIPTFAHVLDALKRPQPVPIPSLAQLMIDLVEFVWVSCSQSPTCLTLLAPFLTNPADSSVLLKRIGPLVSENPSCFIQLVRWDVDKEPWKKKLFRYSNWPLPDAYNSDTNDGGDYFYALADGLLR